MPKTKKVHMPQPPTNVAQVWKKPAPGVDYPDFAALDWQPVRITAALNHQDITISTPFSGVDVEDIPDVLAQFGGMEHVAATLRHSRGNKRELAFRLSRDPKLPPLLNRANVLSRIPTFNSFILEMEAESVIETTEEKAERSRKELSAVQRVLGVQLQPLPPRFLSATLTHFISATYVFDKLWDYDMCPAVVLPPDVNMDTGEQQIVLQSIVSQILPSLPFSEETDPSKTFLYFPAARFTNQTSFYPPEYIPSLYLDPMASQEKVSNRLRKNYSQKMKWIGAKRPDIPSQADAGALRNLSLVPESIVSAAKKLLVEQPIWRRDHFYDELKKEAPDMLKEHTRFVLPGLSYRCVKGPWSRMWCRLGYDPLLDPDCRKFQTIDYRINWGLLQKKRTILGKKSTLSQSARMLRDMVTDVPKAGGGDESRGLQQIFQLIQLTDLEAIRAILEDPERIRAECSAKEGHFVDGTMEEIRLEITRAISREDEALLKMKGLVSRAQSMGFFKNTPTADVSLEESDSEDD